MIKSTELLKPTTFYPQRVVAQTSFSVKCRSELIVYLYHLKQCRLLKKYGTIQYVSRKMRYVVLTTPADSLAAIKQKLPRLRFVKHVQSSPKANLPQNFSPAFLEFKEDVRQRLPLAACAKTAKHGAVTVVENINETSANLLGFVSLQQHQESQPDVKSFHRPKSNTHRRHKKCMDSVRKKRSEHKKNAPKFRRSHMKKRKKVSQ